MQLCGRKEVVFDSIAGSEHSGLFKSRNVPHGFELSLFGQGRGESVEICLNGLTSFRFNEDLVSLLVGKAVDLVLNARTVSRPFSRDCARKEWAVLEAVVQDVVYSRVCVRDVARVLLRQVEWFIVAEGLCGWVSLLYFGFGEVDAPSINSWWGALKAWFKQIGCIRSHSFQECSS